MIMRARICYAYLSDIVPVSPKTRELIAILLVIRHARALFFYRQIVILAS